MQVPRIEKITLNMGVGEAKTECEAARRRDGGADDHRRPALRRFARRASRSRIQDPRGDAHRREGDAPRRAHVRVPRPARLDRAAANPGLPRAEPHSFDGRGNYSLGVREQIIFPEIDYDAIQQVRGLDVTITTSAKTDEQARALLQAFGLPFASADGQRRD